MYRMREQTIPSHGEAYTGPQNVNPSIRRRLTRGSQRVSTKTCPKDQQLVNLCKLLIGRSTLGLGTRNRTRGKERGLFPAGRATQSSPLGPEDQHPKNRARETKFTAFLKAVSLKQVALYIDRCFPFFFFLVCPIISYST